MTLEQPRTLTGRRAELLRQRLRANGDGEPGIPGRTDGTPPPLSFAQERLWFMDQLAPGTAAYTVPIAVRLTGPLDVDRLRAALNAVAARHESLRTRVVSTVDGRPVAVVDESVAVPLTVHPMESGGPADREAAARRLVARTGAEPFDLTTGPLLRAALIPLADRSADSAGPRTSTGDEHVLMVVLHHIAADGWSIDVFLRDLLNAYGQRDPGAPPVRYGDYAAWQREQYPGARLADDLRYWGGQLAGVPPLDLPTDRPRPPEQRFGGAGCAVAFGAELGRAVSGLGRRCGATPYMTLLAAYQALLGRYSGQDDFAIGSTVAGRPRPELEGVVGLFANVLALRADLAGDPTFSELLARVRDRVLDAFGHQEMPFDRLVTELRLPRDVTRSPVFQATFTMLNYGQGGLPDVGLRVQPFPIDARQTRFDLELYLFDPQASGFAGFFTYSTELFEAATIERLAHHLERLLHAVVADPDVRLSRIPLFDPAEPDLALCGPTVDIGPPATLSSLVEAQVRRTPDAVAVTLAEASLTYRELNARANRLARRLRSHGVGAGAIVAVCAERSLELVVALLAVVKAGGAYLPLDPEYPKDRLAFMLGDAAPAVLLVAPSSVPSLPEVDLATIVLEPDLDLDPAGADDLPPVARPEDAAYVIYTSGSTGRPKGVPNPHRGIHNRLDWMQRTFGLGPDDVVLQKTPAGFDVSVWEFFWPLLAGARLVLARPGGHKDAAYLRDLIIHSGVTTVHFVPSMLAIFLTEEGIEACTSLRRIIASGEVLPVPVAQAVHQRLDCQLYNLYGPTEAAIDVTAFECRPESLAGLARVPIGAPIQNIRIYLLDGAGQPVPVGVPGELHIAGVGVALGYLNRPELTAQRFRADPYGRPGERWYATGDLARRRRDGTIDYLGRLDQQVKLRGLRIELGEIESVLREQDGVGDAVVVVREDRPGDQRLVAYLVGSGADPDPAALRSALKAVLPDYMVPASYVPMAAFPLTPNGKLDRRALPEPARAGSSGDAFVAPRTELERLIADVWLAVLGAERVGIDDDFFNLGGHSLLATQVVARLRTALPADAGRVSVMDLFKQPTVRQLAELVAVPADQRGPRRLLYELSRPLSAQARPAGPANLTFVCVPYGGGSAVVYQPLADALPAGYSLYALAIPGHDIGLDEQHTAFDQLVRDAVAEILERIDGPIAVYGHCGVGGALAVALACSLEAAGRRVETVYTGAIFPFARPQGRFAALRTRLERLRSDRIYVNWLTSLGIDLSDIDPEQVRTLIRSTRADSEAAEEYFTDLLQRGVDRLRAPIVSVIGERDDMTMFYEERYREWHFLTDTAALFVLDEAGHYFLKYRAAELATILTGTQEDIVHGDVARLLPAGRGPDATWWLHGVSTAVASSTVAASSTATPATSPATVAPATSPATVTVASATGPGEGPKPSMRRFVGVAGSQFVSMVGSAMTEFAVPIWIYLRTGSLVRFALFSAVALVPGLVILPLAGAMVDRYSRRRVMLLSDLTAAVVQGLFLALVLTDRLQFWQIYVLLAALSVALTFQRLAYASAIPQLVPKRYLGHANGLVQIGGGVAQFLVPVAAVGVMAAIGLSGILAFDVFSYAVAVVVLACVRFPALMAYRRRETVSAEIRTGFRYAMGSPGFRAMLLFFASINIFLGPLLILIQPLVLGFGPLRAVTEVAVAGGLGVTAGGVVMAVWGGPARRKMLGVLCSALAISASFALTGLRPSVPLVAIGVFGTFAGLTIMNTIYATIVQVKVPPRFHGRVFAVQTLVAFCTLPIGFVVVGPLVSGALAPLLQPGGRLAGSVGQVIGTGPGRGIALTYLVFATVIALIVVVASRYPPLARFDRDVPDAEPDDVVGLAELRRRGRSVTGNAGQPPGGGNAGQPPGGGNAGQPPSVARSDTTTLPNARPSRRT